MTNVSLLAISSKLSFLYLGLFWFLSRIFTVIAHNGAECGISRAYTGRLFAVQSSVFDFKTV